MRYRWSRLCALGAVPVAALALAACGGSSKPAYCSSVTNLENSVKSLTNVSVLKNGTSSLTAALQKIESNAKTVVSSAKSDFPSETSAVSSSINALSSSVKQVSGTPSAAQIVTIGQQATAAATAVKSFSNATSSKCG